MNVLGSQFNGIRGEVKCRPDPATEAIPSLKDGDLAARVMELPCGGETRSSRPNHDTCKAFMGEGGSAMLMSYVTIPTASASGALE